MLRIYRLKIEKRYKEVFYDKLNKGGCVVISFWLIFYVNCCFWYILFFLGTLA